MNFFGSMATNKKSKIKLPYKNPAEVTGNNPFDFDDSSFGEKKLDQQKEQSSAPIRKEFSLFSYQEYYERELVKKQIKELVEQIRKEIELIKKADKSLLAQVSDIENIAVEQLPEKPGIYHIRFLEIVLRVLQSLRQKIGESKTWLSAMISRKKKRGSLFLSLSKKKGTQYSLSQELQTARAVQ
jgi:hypothetical protein